jgi:hypothetical protein
MRSTLSGTPSALPEPLGEPEIELIQRRLICWPVIRLKLVAAAIWAAVEPERS